MNEKSVTDRLYEALDAVEFSVRKSMVIEIVGDDEHIDAIEEYAVTYGYGDTQGFLVSALRHAYEADKLDPETTTQGETS